MIILTGGKEQKTLLKQLKGMKKYFNFEIEVKEDEISEQEIEVKEDEIPKAPKCRKKTV